MRWNSYLFEKKIEKRDSSRRDLQNALLCAVLESNPKNQENRGEKEPGAVLVGAVLVGSVWVKKYTKINIEKMKILFATR